MLLTLAKFQAFSRAVQIGTALMEGTHLATRYEGEDLITLYYLGSFFVEVYYDPESN
ncbi:hypothetical protein [Hymenobacter crusticola]|uniref:hypothetical protein n=1 Tax=Hymenobacter crusticola TaxID=1770526 RepID=UPI0015C4FF7E|nr:hypothetical protein [Hymenobacter crusticola]